MARDIAPKPKPLKAAEVEARFCELVKVAGDDKTLRKALEELATQPAFPGLTWLWGPMLYQRQRVLFRPFILSHFASWQFDPPLTWKTIYWTGDTGKRLEAWLGEADRNDDVAMFKRLLQWKLSAGNRWKYDPKPLIDDLTKRFLMASSSPERAVLLQKFDIWFEFDEPSALTLYQHDETVAGPFILKHLPNKWSWWGGSHRELWRNLLTVAEKRGDLKTVFSLYRRQIPLTNWEQDVLALCEKAVAPEVLCEELEQRHPEGWGLDLGSTLAKLLEKRGMIVWAYLQKHLFQVHQGWIFHTGYDAMLALAKKNGWWLVWAGLLRVCAKPLDYNREIRDLLNDPRTPEAAKQERLLMLTGVARELNFSGFGLAQVKPLDDETALALYERFPQLLHGPFKMHLMLSYHQAYPKIIDRLLQTDEESLIDYLASRAITRLAGGVAGNENLVIAEKLSAYYERLRDTPARFANRAGAVLGQIPAFAVFDYTKLVQQNRLARLLFERTLPSWLEDPVAVSNLVEAAEIHVQQLAYRILGLANPLAAQLAHQNLFILLGTLLRPLHRRTRIFALQALFNSAIDAASAQMILKRAREALDLPDVHYPKEKLLGLIACLLARWPELRDPTEIPRVFEKGTT